MFSNKKWITLIALVAIVAMVLPACAPPTPEVIVKEVPVEKEVVRTVVVEKEVPVEIEKEVPVEKEVVKTVVVEKEVEKEVVKEVEVVVTATPVPEPTAVPLAAVSPEFKNPDTYMVVAGAGEPETMDIAWQYDTASQGILSNIYEGPVWFSRERTDVFVPVLATDWEVNETGDVWTFTIREGVTFHEGGTLEPHDVAYSLQRALLQDRIDGPHWMTLEAFFGLYTIEDLAMSISGAASFEEVSDADLVATCEQVKAAVVADDEAGTVTYNLYSSTPWFLAMLTASYMGGTLDMEWMAENGGWDGSCDTWVDYHDPLVEDTILFNNANGTGPYVFDHWTPGEEIVLVANENYWRTEPMWEGGPSGVASIKRVLWKNIPEWGTRLAMFEAGDADFIYTPPQYRPQLEPYYKEICYEGGDDTCEAGNPDGYIKVFRDMARPAMTPAQFNWNISLEGGNPYVGSGELDGNGIPPDFFSDEHVRYGFNYCFDFQAMIDAALNGEGQQAQGPIIAGMMGYREGEAPLFSYDPAKCEEELKQAFGGEVWEKGFYMQLAYNHGNDTRRLASEILKAGVEAVNPKFNISVVAMPWPVLLNTRRARKLPIYVGGWLEDFHDPHNWVHPFLHSQGAYGRVINMPEDIAAEFDALINEAASLTTVEERRPIYEEIQLKAQEDAVVIWMYQQLTRHHVQPWIKGYYFNPAYSSQANSYVYALSKEAP
jgi:peptide/nickel transport system substrate-binding protein